MPLEPFRLRVTADGAGTLDAVHATVKLVDRAEATDAIEPWLWYRGSDLSLNNDDEVTFWGDRTGNGRDVPTIGQFGTSPWPRYTSDQAGFGQPGIRARVDPSTNHVLYGMADYDPDTDTAQPVEFADGITVFAVGKAADHYDPGDWWEWTCLLLGTTPGISGRYIEPIIAMNDQQGYQQCSGWGDAFFYAEDLTLNPPGFNGSFAFAYVQGHNTVDMRYAIEGRNGVDLEFENVQIFGTEPLPIYIYDWHIRMNNLLAANAEIIVFDKAMTAEERAPWWAKLQQQYLGLGSA